MIKKKSGIIIIIFFYSFILAIVSGLQIFGKNPDYIGYEEIFSNTFDRADTEPIFTLFRYINDNLFDSSLISVFLFFSLFSLQIKIMVMYELAENIICFLFSLFYYFITFFLIHEYTQIRAASAIAIYFLALLDLKNDRIFLFYVKAAIAVLFHYSSIVMFVFPFFMRIFCTRKRLLIVMSIGIAFAFISNTLFGVKLQNFIYTIENILKLNKSGNVSNFIKPFNLKYTVLTLACVFILLLIDLDKKKFYFNAVLCIWDMFFLLLESCSIAGYIRTLGGILYIGYCCFVYKYYVACSHKREDFIITIYRGVFYFIF